MRDAAIHTRSRYGWLSDASILETDFKIYAKGGFLVHLIE